MSKPILIWTLRRTGGTTLTDLLQQRSEYPVVDQEPFNWDRCFGAVAKRWHKVQNKTVLREDLAKVLSARPTIKHCHELHNDAFNAMLFATATELGYRHMILDRRDEVGRILSLELAKLTGAWGKMGSEERYRKFESGELQMEPIDIPVAVAHMKQCEIRRKNLHKLVQNSGLAVREVFFEDIYTDPNAGRVLIHAILADFDLENPDDPALEQLITTALVYRGQNSARMLGVIPNVNEAEKRLKAALTKLRPAQP